MKLGLLGYPIEHSLSPSLYKRLLGDQLTSYELFSYPTPRDIPPLDFFHKSLDGLNITAPYKAHFLDQVIIREQSVHELGAINTISFKGTEAHATNTDYLAVVEIFKKYLEENGTLKVLLLGDGAMARLTLKVCETFNIPVVQFSRKLTPEFERLDLRPYTETAYQTIIINSCSRDFIFQGSVQGSEIFWDYNYAFPPHENSLPGKFKAYYDGREMLELQAKAAIKFWKTNS